MKLIEKAWLDYAIRVIPMKAPVEQRHECRRAFYAGADALFHGILGALSPDAEPTEEDLKRMDEIHDELERFVALVLAGKA